MPVVRISEELFKEIQKYAEPLVDNFESALWKALKSNKNNGERITGNVKPYKKHELTPQKAFRRPILETIIELGGRGEAKKIVELVGKKMSKEMTLGDFSENCDGSSKWEKAVNFQRLTMVHDGLLKNNSQRGIWEITDNGKEWLSTYSG